MKNLLILLMVMCVPLAFYAQDEDSKKNKKEKQYWFSVGSQINYRSLTALPDNQWIIDAKNKFEIPTAGFSCGFFKSSMRNGKVGIEFGIGLNYRTIKTKKTEFTSNNPILESATEVVRIYESSYVHFPFMLKFRNPKSGFYGKAGLAFDQLGVYSPKEKVFFPDGKTRTQSFRDIIPKRNSLVSFKFLFGKEFKFKNWNPLLRVELLFQTTGGSYTKEIHQTYFYSFGINTSIKMN